MKSLKRTLGTKGRWYETDIRVQFSFHSMKLPTKPESDDWNHEKAVKSSNQGEAKIFSECFRIERLTKNYTRKVACISCQLYDQKPTLEPVNCNVFYHKSCYK